MKGIIIENTGNVDCTVFVIWPDEQQQLDLALGETKIVAGMPNPLEVSAIKR